MKIRLTLLLETPDEVPWDKHEGVGISEREQLDIALGGVQDGTEHLLPGRSL